jgi:hypothetical protein
VGVVVGVDLFVGVYVGVTDGVGVFGGVEDGVCVGVLVCVRVGVEEGSGGNIL